MTLVPLMYYPQKHHSGGRVLTDQSKEDYLKERLRIKKKKCFYILKKIRKLSIYLSLDIKKNKIQDFGTVLQKNCAEITQKPHILHVQLALLVTSLSFFLKIC